MTGKSRLIALLLALTVIFAMLFSACFIIAEADHDCTGEDCPVCCQLSACEDALKYAGLCAFSAVIAAFVIVFRSVPAFFAGKSVQNISLVALKVKLSD